MVLLGSRVSRTLRQLTTVIVPINTSGGVRLFDTISEIKLAVMPMIAMSEHAWKTRASWRAAPRAPYWGVCISKDYTVEGPLIRVLAGPSGIFLLEMIVGNLLRMWSTDHI